MSGDHGGLPAIHPYLIERQHWLQEIRHLRAFKRVHGTDKPGARFDRKHHQKQLCKLRKEKYK